ncbi:MAG: hypothetical protein WA160_06680 [Pseudobdellovibrio sp.]
MLNNFEKAFEKKITFIKKQIQNLELNFILSTDFGSSLANYRQNIRKNMEDNYSYCFNRQQLANLADLNLLPQASEGFFSISHTQNLGGFSFSNFKHGFDLENSDRISKNIILRTSSEAEVLAAPDAKFLWVAKEAALKGMANLRDEYILTDFICEGWQSHSGNDVFSYRINSKKTLDFSHNKGFVFSEKDILYSIFYK